MLRKTLLVCGILSSMLYAAMTVVIAMQWEGYSSASQTISELSAIGAPTRPGGTRSDTLHLVLASVTVLLMLLAIGCAASAFGKPFRRYSIATLAILAAFGAMTFVEAPRLAANLPTPWLGVWERINIGVFLLWVVVLAVALLRAEDTAARTAGRPALAA